MPFIPLNHHFPDLARNETRTITVLENSNLGLPPGEFGFYEMFCDEAECDCRRVFFVVYGGTPPEVCATIAFGWESTEFYEDWSGEDAEYAQTLKGPGLNLAGSQGPLAPALLSVVKNILLQDEEYVARVKRHYDLFRQEIDKQNSPASSTKLRLVRDEEPSVIGATRDNESDRRGVSRPAAGAEQCRDEDSSVATSASVVLTHTNRLGRTYYLHEGRTKTGKPRYFARKTIGDGPLTKMPSGFEFSESINGVVSVRRVDTSGKMIPTVDVQVLSAELARHEHLRSHAVDVKKDAIIICEPVGGIQLRDFETTAGHMLIDPAILQRIASVKPSRFEPVMKFERTQSIDAPYAAFRMTYRGDGGWYMLSTGELSELVESYVGHIGTDEFFELL